MASSLCYLSLELFRSSDSGPEALPATKDTRASRGPLAGLSGLRIRWRRRTVKTLRSFSTGSSRSRSNSDLRLGPLPRRPPGGRAECPSQSQRQQPGTKRYLGRLRICNTFCFTVATPGPPPHTHKNTNEQTNRNRRTIQQTGRGQGVGGGGRNLGRVPDRRRSRRSRRRLAARTCPLASAVVAEGGAEAAAGRRKKRVRRRRRRRRRRGSRGRARRTAFKQQTARAKLGRRPSLPIVV